jgi:hypothetical protein
MAYHNGNYLKKIETIRSVYNEVKESDKPDSFIVRKIFPQRNINISYSCWMFIKHYGKSRKGETNQLNLFDQSAA